MKYLALFLTALLALITYCQAEIIELTDENFGNLISKQDEWLIDFYADWCGYCKRLEPKFFVADRLLKKSTHNHVKMGKVNVESNPGLAARFFVSRLPTIVHVINHEVRTLKPTQNENDIISFVTLEEWHDVEPKSKMISPFSVFGEMISTMGKIIKKLSAYSPWTLIGVLTGFLIFFISLPVLLNNKKYSEQLNLKKIEAENEKVTETKKSPQLRGRKSKRID